MHFTHDVDIPDALVNAQENGDLVVFAGAGISKPPPSNLPGWPKLVEEIAGRAYDDEDLTAFDTFLGRLSQKGVNVHQRAQHCIFRRKPEPTAIHHNLLRLFAGPANVRLITTNFDTNFLSAVSETFDRGVDVYRAPAIPHGGDFHGIVHLHGAIDANKPENLILTDEDFGRAYLTRGWATRFLLPVFSKYSVLFVGYSYSDPVLRYLTRAIPISERDGYAFSPGPRERWRQLGIEQIPYPVEKDEEGTEDHNALEAAVESWADFTEMDHADHDNRIESLVDMGPPANDVDSDYIQQALNDTTRAEFFTERARSLEWLYWINQLSAFRRLFSRETDPGNAGPLLGHWFATTFVIHHPQKALSLYQQHGAELNMTLWRKIAGALGREGASHPDALNQWIPVILDQEPQDIGPYQYEMILQQCTLPETTHATLALIEAVTEPKPVFRATTSYTRNDTSLPLEVKVSGERHWLEKAWEEFLEPNLDQVSTELYFLLVSHLSKAHSLFSSYGIANTHSDPWNTRRSAIEEHPQNFSSQQDSWDVLVDWLREVLDWRLSNDPCSTSANTSELLAADAPLLRRFAVYSVANSREMDADQKIRWMLDNDLLYSPPLKHEVFNLLASAFPNSSSDIREEVIDRGRSGPELPDHVDANDPETEKRRQYSIYNLFVHLEEHSPTEDSRPQEIKEQFEKREGFTERDHPDLDSWMEGWTGQESPLSTEELLQRSPREILDFLLTFEGDQFGGPTRDGLLLNVRSATEEEPAWGRKLAVALEEEDEFSTDLWRSVFGGLRDSEPSEDQWSYLVDNALQLEEVVDQWPYEVLIFLYESLESLDRSQLSRVEDLSRQLWLEHEQKFTTSPDKDVRMQFNSALNHLGGRTAMIWLKSLSRRRNQFDEIGHVPDKHRQFFQRIIRTDTDNALCSKVLIYNDLSFLFSTDEEWTEEILLPALSFDRSPNPRPQWAGLLRGGWSKQLLQKLLPYYDEASLEITGSLEPWSDSLTKHFVGIAFSSIGDPRNSDWYWNFFENAYESDYSTWTETIGFHLRELDDQLISELWETWLKEYWWDRSTGVPAPLTEAEAREMVKWPARMSAIFPEAVERVLDMRVPDLGISLLYRRLDDNDLASEHPVPLAALLNHLLSAEKRPFHGCDGVSTIVRDLLASNVQSGTMRELVEELARLGCPQTTELRQLIDHS